MPTQPDPGSAEMFESIYVRAGDDLDAIPWARLAPSPALLAWLEDLATRAGASALVVGCGLGDDAEELSRRGLATTAFDVSPTAIERCRERFPDTAVEYLVADVFELPHSWTRAYDVIVEIRTLQSLPPGTRQEAARSIGETLAPGGQMLVVAYIRPDGRRVGGPPWPVTEAELATFEHAGLRRERFDDEPLGADGDRTATIVYTR
jgi:SAM-dependent methyltransferase